MDRKSALVIVIMLLGTSWSSAQTPAKPRTATRTPPKQVATKPPLTNADIIKMVKASLSADVIMTAIDGAEKRAFDLAPDGLIALKSAGVPDAIIAVMQKTNKHPASPPPDAPTPPPSTLTTTVASKPAALQIPTGTEVKVALTRAISSDASKVGDRVDLEV